MWTQQEQELSGTEKPTTLSCWPEQGMRYKLHLLIKAASYQLNFSLLLGIMLDTSTTTLTEYVREYFENSYNTRVTVVLVSNYLLAITLVRHQPYVSDSICYQDIASPSTK